MKAENGRSKDVPNSNVAAGNSSQSSRASANPSEKFVGRWPADNQELRKTSISPTTKDPPTAALGSGPVGRDATMPSALSTVAPALAAATVPLVSASPPASPEPKKRQTVFSRAESAGRNDTASAATQSNGEKRKAAAAPPIASRPLSLVPDEQSDVAVSTQSASRLRGGFAVQVASERSAADAETVFRTLQNKFPTLLGGREPIVRRSDLGPEGSYYQALIGPFGTIKEATAVCRTLKAAGGSCLVERN